MRKYLALFISLILVALVGLMPVDLNAQRTSGLSGTGLDGFVEKTDFDSLHVAAGKLILGATGSGQDVTATGVELNYLDITALGTGVNTKAVVLDASGDYTWEAGGIFKYAVLNDGTTALTTSALKLNYLDITTLGTQENSMVVTTDGSGNSGVSKVTQLWIGATGVETQVTSTAAQLNALPATTASAAELDYNAGVTAGTGLADKVMTLDVGDDFTWPATGLLTYWGTQVTSTGAELNYVDITTLGTQEANKVVTTDVNSNSGISQVTELWIGATNAEVQILATPAEIDRIADKDASVVDVTGASVSITLAAHGDRIITLNRAAGITVTLDAATGTGASYTFIIGTSCTSGSYIIKVANGTDVFDGGLALGVDIDGEGATGYTWYAVAGDDTFTMPAAGPASGGEVGDVIRVTDYATGFFLIEAHIQQGGAGEATPFSSGV